MHILSKVGKYIYFPKYIYKSFTEFMMDGSGRAQKREKKSGSLNVSILVLFLFFNFNPDQEKTQSGFQTA